MNVKFTVTTAAKLGDLAVTNGQLVYLQDQDEAYYDLNNTRNRIGGVAKVTELPETGREGTIYVVVDNEGNGTACIWNNTTSSYIMISGGSGDTNTSKKRYQIAASSWSSTADASGYYSYTLALVNQSFTASTAINLYIAGSTDSTYPTDTEKSMYALVERVELYSINSVKLYAKTKPTSTFYVYVGADGGYAQGGGASILGDLEDVTLTSPTAGQVLSYDAQNSIWVNSTPTSTLSALTDTTITSPADGQTLVYDGTAQKWVNRGGILTGTLTAGQTTLTINSAIITTDSLMDVYTSVFGVAPTAMTVSTGSVQMTFTAQQTDVSVKIIVR